jgi:glycosyltransferase involved in cell wall biosynthesis
MRILIACSWALPHAGGINTYINQLTKGLQRAGHHVDIFSSTTDGQGYFIQGKDSYIDKNKLLPLIAYQTNRYMDHHLPGLDPWIKHSEIERYCIEAAAAYFGLADYDIIHTQDIVSAHAFSRIKPPNTALVTTIHGCLAKEWFVKLKEMGLPEQDTSSPLWHYSALREYLGATVSDVTISPSRWLKELLVKDFSVPEHKMVVSPYGIDVDDFRLNMMRDTTIAKPPARKVFMCPARFDVVKGHIHLLHALAKLKEDRSDWECWFVGDGALREELRHTTVILGLADHVIFTGNRDDVPSLIRQADIIVLPSMQDNQPFAIIEAQIAGKPVIVSDAGGIPEMVTHSSTGIVFRSGDSNQLHLFLRSALEDDTLFHAMAIHAKVWGEQYWSLPAMTSRVLELYELARGIHLGQDRDLEPQHIQQIRVRRQRGGRRWRALQRKRRIAGIKTRRRRNGRRRLAR